mmetsp:Transcript_22141/g.73292  ORF Transcript_22141/g.73292 Transcript_22141/m.73292 type:complete len:434 (-) Transcript_22141:674-1975(-)
MVAVRQRHARPAGQHGLAVFAGAELGRRDVSGGDVVVFVLQVERARKRASHALVFGPCAAALEEGLEAVELRVVPGYCPRGPVELLEVPVFAVGQRAEPLLPHGLGLAVAPVLADGAGAVQDPVLILVRGTRQRLGREPPPDLAAEEVAERGPEPGDLEDARRRLRGDPDAPDLGHGRRLRLVREDDVDQDAVKDDLDLMRELDALARLRVDDDDGALAGPRVLDDERVVQERPLQVDGRRPGQTERLVDLVDDLRVQRRLPQRGAHGRGAQELQRDLVVGAPEALAPVLLAAALLGERLHVDEAEPRRRVVAALPLGREPGPRREPRVLELVVDPALVIRPAAADERSPVEALRRLGDVRVRRRLAAEKRLAPARPAPRPRREPVEEPRALKVEVGPEHRRGDREECGARSPRSGLAPRARETVDEFLKLVR